MLGVFLIFYGLNQFFHFLSTSYGQMPTLVRDFIDAVVWYLPFLYAFEILIGLFVILNRWTSFILIVLFPLSISFLIFIFANGNLPITWPALVVAALNVILVFSRKEKYTPLFD